MLKIIAITLLSSTAAFAVEVPVSGPYGNADTCVYKAVAKPVMTADTGFLLRPDGLYGLETSCSPTYVKGATVTLSCAVDDPAPMPLSATITEDKAAGTVTARTDQFGEIVLHRCN